MSWKKNAFSYVIWFLYTVMTGLVLVGLADLFCSERGLPFYLGVAFVVLYAMAAGGIVVLVHRFATGYRPIAVKKQEHLLVLETLLFLILLGVGIAFRAEGAGSVPQSLEYYEMARVVAGHKIPQTVHGAVYFYVQALHALFGLLGNHFLAGIWFQIVLQLLAMSVLYLTMRKLAGAVAALTVFGFGMCAPYMVRNSLVLSPDMLYFFVLTVSGALIAMLGRRAFGKGMGLWAFFGMGLVASICCYIDIAGVLLLVLALSIACSRRKRAIGIGRRSAAGAICVLGGLIGLGACAGIDALFSGKPFLRVAQAWLLLYRPEGFRLPVVFEDVNLLGGALSVEGAFPIVISGFVWEGLVLFALMAFGIFSFWCDRQGERISAGVLAVWTILLAWCYGIFTDEMPGFFYLYLLFAMLAGIGLGQCFRTAHAGAAEGEGREVESGLETGKESGRTEGQEGEVQAAADTLGGGADIADAGRDIPEEGIGPREVRYLENPLPLPKKHEKRVLDYPLPPAAEEDDFDHPVADDDDFDI